MGFLDKIRGGGKSSADKRLEKLKSRMPKTMPEESEPDEGVSAAVSPMPPAEEAPAPAAVQEPARVDAAQYAMPKLNLDQLMNRGSSPASEAEELPTPEPEAEIPAEIPAPEESVPEAQPEPLPAQAEPEIPVRFFNFGEPESEPEPEKPKQEAASPAPKPEEEPTEAKKGGKFSFLFKKISRGEPEAEKIPRQTVPEEKPAATAAATGEDAADNRTEMERLADQIQARYPGGIKSLYALQSDMQFCVEIPRVIRNQKEREELKGLLRERKLLQSEQTEQGETDGVTEVTQELFEQFMNRLTDDNQGMLFSYTQVADNRYFQKTLPLYEDFARTAYGMPLEEYLVVRRKLAAEKETLARLGLLPEFSLRCAPDSSLEQYAVEQGITHTREETAAGSLRRFQRVVRVTGTEKGNCCYACLKLRLYEPVTLLCEPEGQVAVYNCDNELCGYIEDAERQWVATAMGFEKIRMDAPVAVEHGFISPEGKFRRKPTVALYFHVEFDAKKYVLYAKTHFAEPMYFAPAPKEPEKSPEGYVGFHLENSPELLEPNTRRIEGLTLRSMDDLSDWDYTLRPDGTVALKGYSGDQTRLTLPSSIDGWPVTEIPKDGFRDLKTTLAVRIPGSIESIGENAFRGCAELQSVGMGEGCLSLGKNAFADCPKLTRVVSPASLRSLADHTPFSGTPWRDETDEEYLMLGSVLLSWQGQQPIMRMPGGIRVYGRCAAAGNPNLKEVIFPDGLEEIAGQAFYPGNKLLEKITVPKSVNYVGENAFRQTKWLSAQTDDFLMINDLLLRYRGAEKTLQMGSSVRIICEGAFQECGIERLWLNDALTEICDNAFRNCSGLRTVSVGNGLRRIGNGAFSGCRSLTGFYLPEKIESVGEKAFWGCSMLDEVQFPPRPIPQGKDAFTGTPHILKKENFAVSAGKLLKYMGNESAVTIPEGVTEIAPRTFAGIRNLVSVKLPESLRVIGREAFANCVCLFEVSGGTGLKAIGFGAFQGCSSLRKYSFHAALRSIGDRAFQGCDLQELQLPRELEYIGKGAFAGRSELTVSDAISPEAQKAGVSYDPRLGTVNSPLSCALLTTKRGELLCDADTVNFAPVRISVKSASGGSVKHSFYFDGRGESRAYRAWAVSCFAKKGEIDWTGFDGVFRKIRNPLTRMINAYDRLKNSPTPEEDRKLFYQNYLRRILLIPESYAMAEEYILQNDDRNLLALLVKLGAVTEELRPKLLEAARERQAVKCEKVLTKS